MSFTPNRHRPENPLLSELPLPRDLAATNHDQALQADAIMGITGVISRLMMLALREDMAEVRDEPGRLPSAQAVAASSEDALLQRYGDYPDVLARLVVTRELGIAVTERKRELQEPTKLGEGAVLGVTSADATDILIRAMSRLIDEPNDLTPAEEEMAQDMRNELVDMAEKWTDLEATQP